MGKLVLSYWPLRGLCEPIKYLLECQGFDYELKVQNGELWQSEKPTIDLDFPNLPYLVDGDVKISESFAIMKYLARKSKVLMPQTDKEILACDIAEGAISDMRMGFFMLIFKPNFETEKVKYAEESFPNKLKLVEKVLSKNTWIAGERLTFVDFVLYEVLDVHQMFLPGCLDKYENVKNYKLKFEALDGIAAYKKSDRFKAYPVTGGSARWGLKP